MSKALLSWFDRHPQQVYVWPVGGLILLALGLAVLPLLRDQPEKPKGHDWSWSLLIFGILLAGRWPTFFFARMLNADEGQLLAGALTLRHDPVFWRSVNGATAGPLDFFALWPAGWLCGADSYLAARLTALGLLVLGFTLLHQCLALITGRQVARITSLAVVSFEALTRAPDFLHYSTELLPVALLAAAAYAAVRRWTTGGGPLWGALGGVLLGATPLAKVQAIPLAAGLGLGWLAAEFFSKDPAAWHRRAYLMAGALVPITLFASQLLLAGEWQNFVVSYFYYNFNYVGVNPSTAAATLLETWRNSIFWGSALHLWLPACAGWMLLMLRLRPVPDQAIRHLAWAAAAACLIALASVFAPHRPFLHYWQLLIGPGCLLLGALTARLLSTSPTAWRKPERWLVAACAAGVTGALLVQQTRTPNPYLGDCAYFLENPRSELSARVFAHARPGDAIAIWGWSNQIYVETGLRQATRDPHIGPLFETGYLRAYFRQRYLADLRFTKPALFLDSVGPDSLQYISPEYAHEKSFPELARVIMADYKLVETAGRSRIYRRKDIPAP